MAEASESTATPTSPEVVGKYELLARLGSGRNCDVFLAVRRGAERRRIVALKRLRERLTNREGASAALLREAELASQIKHAKVVDVYEYGDEGGACYIAMEYLAGQPLGALIRRAGKGLPTTCVARIGADIADGLAAAHRLTDDDGKPLGLVHFDVSPSNVQVLYDGRVLLVDFGLARALSEEPGTRGKVGYLAPEQVTSRRGGKDAAAPDARIDLFALGIVLWEAATGKRLYREADREATLAAIADKDAPRASSVRDDIDEELDDIIAKALARDPDERYQTGRELATALRGYLASSDATDTTNEISDLILEHFESERGMADEAVANAMAVLAGERSGPRARRASTIDDPEPDVPDVAATAADGEGESDYYYYDDEEPAAAAAPEPAPAKTEDQDWSTDETEEAPAVAAVASTAMPRAASSADSDPIDALDDDDADIIGGSSKRSWLVGIAAAALILVLLVVIVVALGGKSDKPKSAAGPTDDSATKAPAKAVDEKPTPAPAPVEPETDPEPAIDPAIEAAKKAEEERLAAEKADVERLAAETAANAEEEAKAAAAAAAAAEKKAAAEADKKAAAARAADEAVARKAARAAEKKAAAAAKREAREKRKAEAAVRRKARAEARAKARAEAKAKAAVEPAPKRDKGAARAAYQAASRMLVTGNPGAAVRKYKEALKAWPGYSPALRGLGLANERQGKNKSAIRYYKRYLRAAPRAKDADSIRARINRLGG